MTSDPLVHLIACPITITFRDRTYTIPAMNTTEWMRILGGENVDLYDIFPTLAGSEAIEHVEDVIWDELDGSDEVRRLACEIITVAGDRPWWVTVRLVGLLRDDYKLLGGDLALAGIRGDVPLAMWLDCLWSLVLRRIDPKKVTSWVHQVETPPKEWQEETDVEAEERAFMAAMRAVA